MNFRISPSNNKKKKSARNSRGIASALWVTEGHAALWTPATHPSRMWGLSSSLHYFQFLSAMVCSFQCTGLEVLLLSFSSGRYFICLFPSVELFSEFQFWMTYYKDIEVGRSFVHWSCILPHCLAHLFAKSFLVGFWGDHASYRLRWFTFSYLGSFASFSHLITWAWPSSQSQIEEVEDSLDVGLVLDGKLQPLCIEHKFR